MNLLLRCIPASESLNRTISQGTLPSWHTELLFLLWRSQTLLPLGLCTSLSPCLNTPTCTPTHIFYFEYPWISSYFLREAFLALPRYPRPMCTHRPYLSSSLQLWHSSSSVSFYLVSLCTQPRTQPWVGPQKVFVVWIPQISLHPHICETFKSGVSFITLYLLENSFPQGKQIPIPVTFGSEGKRLLELHREWQDMQALTDWQWLPGVWCQKNVEVASRWWLEFSTGWMG